MDFLDPRKRRAHSIRLMVGYVLVAIAIILGAVLLFNAASGYGVNTKTGEIIQNGLLFVDSFPGGADISLNNKSQGSRTSARLILPAGNYKLTLKKDSYRTWERNFNLPERSIARFVYPFLFPVKPQIQPLRNYSSSPIFMSQSPDKHWLLVESPSSAGNAVTFDQYDTGDLTLAPKLLTLPPALLANSDSSEQSLKEVEWSTDNKHVLLQHNYQGGSEFIIFNRDSPADSFNVNQLFNISPSQVSLRDKKIDQLYIFNQASGELQLGDTSKVILAPLLKRVLAFKSSGQNLITYVTDLNMSSGQVQARIWDSSKSYPLYTFDAGTNYLVEMAQFQGHWYYVAGSDSDERVNIYKDPLSGLKDPSIGKAIPLLSLHIKGADKISFSTNTRFIEAEAGQTLAVYDIETQSSYHYTLTAPLSSQLHWMDGHRLIATSQNAVFISDYDSTNQQLLVPTSYSQGGFFDRSYKQFLTVAPSADSSSFSLENVDMRAGADLPK